MQNSDLFGSFKRLFSAATDPRPQRSHQRTTNSSEHFLIEGVLTAGGTTKYSVDGCDFRVDRDTWIFGNVSMGCYVCVQGVYDIGAERYARKITVKTPKSKNGKRKITRIQSG